MEEIENLEQRKADIEKELTTEISDYEKLQKLSEEIKLIIESIDEKTMRWMELEEMKESFLD